MSKKLKRFVSSRISFLVVLIICLVVAGFVFAYFISGLDIFAIEYTTSVGNEIKSLVKKITPPPVLDKTAYDLKLLQIANNPVSQASGSTTSSTTPKTRPPLWPVKNVYPNGGAILPFKRIVAYYGNFYSTKMGVLGEYPPDQIIAMLLAEVANWQAADPTTPVVPAIHYIAIVAQGGAGADGKYRARMPDSEIDKALGLAALVKGIVFLDLQVGLSNLPAELPVFEKYFKMPQVHLAIDPEFSMKTGAKPGTVIGSFDAVDINYAAEYLAKIVRDNRLPPKILVVHRFTQPMVTHYKNIELLPEVQIVMDMDGWGPPEQKVGTYNNFIYPEPVQFTGFKLFYKNDLRSPSTRMLTPQDLLKLVPRPSYIQYQ